MDFYNILDYKGLYHTQKRPYVYPKKDRKAAGVSGGAFSGGADRGGKADRQDTLIKHLAEEVPGIRYVTLDYPRLRDVARNDPDLFLQQYPEPLIIDEIQYDPQLLPFIKIRIDEERRPGAPGCCRFTR